MLGNLGKDDKKENIEKKENYEKKGTGDDLVDLKNPELYTYKEEDSIREVREKKEEEWKMRVLEIATKEKNDKVQRKK